MAIIGMGRVGIRSIAAPSGYGTLTTAWISATGETDPIIIGALNTLETSGIANGWLIKKKALYPFVGASAIKHSYNFIDTTKYQIVWSGGLTHSSTGVLPGGVNGIGTIAFGTSVSFGLTPNNINLTTYIRTNVASPNAPDIYIKDSGNNYCQIQAKNPVNNQGAYASVGTIIWAAIADARGCYMGGATSASDTYFYKNGVSLGTSSGAQTSFPGLNLTGFLFSNLSGYSARESALASYGSSLTPAERVSYDADILTFQTTLGRNV